MSNRICSSQLRGQAEGAEPLDSDDIRYVVDAQTLGLEITEDAEQCARDYRLYEQIPVEGELFLGIWCGYRPPPLSLPARAPSSSMASSACAGPIRTSLTASSSSASTPMHSAPAPMKGANGLPGGHVERKGSVSSQYLTAMLMCAPLSTGDIEIVITDTLSLPYIDMTVKLMERFNVEVDVFGATALCHRGGQATSLGEAFVEGDVSSVLLPCGRDHHR